MSAVEQRLSSLRSPRRIPSTIRLAPSAVNELCDFAGSLEAGSQASIGAAGLLFGTAEQELVSVETCKPFSAAVSIEDVSPKREYLDAAFERLLATAKVDPELASLQLVGWYCVHGAGDIAPLCDREIEFHNRRFRRATDLALALKPQQHTGLSIELYSRSSLKTALSRQDFRSGSLRLAVKACAAEPIEVTMRSTVDDDYYFRVFQVLDSLDRAERKASWKRIALSAKRAPLRLAPKWLSSRITGDVNTTTAEPSHGSLPAMTAPPSLLGLGPSESTVNGLPVYSAPAAESTTPTSPPFNSSTDSRAPVRVTSGRTKLPWVAAVVFVLAGGVIFASFYSRVPSALLARSAPRWAMGATPPLGVKVERHEHSLLVRWDARSPAVQSAKQAILHVDDGSQHRTIRLDASEVTNGSVMYTPSSSFVMFRLDVLDSKGSTISESLGVGDGSDSAPITPSLRPGALQTAPVAKTSGAYPKSETRSPRSAAQLVQTEKLSNSRLGAAERAIPPKIKPPTGGNAPTLPVGLGGLSRPPAFTQVNSAMTEAKTSRHPASREVRKPERPASSTQSRASAIAKSPPAQSPKTAVQPVAVKDSVTKSVSTYLPARPLRQVMPNARTLESSVVHTSTDIEVQVRIDDSGHVTEAHVVNNVSNDNNLLNASLDAAREWIFEPAKVNGKNVPSDHAIKFHFRPQLGQQ